MLLKTFVSFVSAGGVFLVSPMEVPISYLDEATQALQSSVVYVSPSVSDISAAEQADLVSKIGSDSIAIVVLPAGARNEISDVPMFINQLAARTDQDTILVSIGGDFEASSVTLSPDTVSELANRAEGGDLSDGLTEFVTGTQQVPDTSLLDGVVDPASNGLGLILGVLPWVFGIVAPVAVVFYIIRRRHIRNSRVAESSAGRSIEIGTVHDETDTPKELRPLVREIERMSAHIKDEQLREEMLDADKHVHWLFKRVKVRTPNSYHQTAGRYQVRLETVSRVLEQYITIQDHPEYYRDYKTRLAQGAKGLRDYITGVIQNIQENEEGSMTDFTVDSQILGATVQQADPILIERNVNDKRNSDRLRGDRRD